MLLNCATEASSPLGLDLTEWTVMLRIVIGHTEAA
jgi:hypothetical protein